MYSVLIQNQKTIQSFQEHYPIFQELFNTNQVGCCRWVESGRTIDTALPGLNDLIDDKEEWRAIIVRIVELDEHDMEEVAGMADPENPYDFLHQIPSENNLLKESSIPLVRLTQMLGEVPAPLQSFEEAVDDQDPRKAPRRIYIPNGVSEDEKAAYEKLVHLYEYDGHKPSDVILVTFAATAFRSDQKNTQKIWKKELGEKSNFVRRNWYSSNCRFVQYRYTREGKVRKEADLFNFWNCVMLLASDTMDPSSLQAYRLYSARIDFNRDELKETFQAKYDELKGCRMFVEESIRHDLEMRMNEKHAKPKYHASISAEIKIPDDTNVVVDTNLFRLCPRSMGNELHKWEGCREIAEASLEAIFRNQDRVLDESANRMRMLSVMPEEEVTPLDKYEKLDMEAELSHTFDEILRTQNTISDTRNVTGEKISSLGNSVKEFIQKRISRPFAIEIGVGLLLLSLLTIVSAFLVPQDGFKKCWPGIVVGFGFVSVGLIVGELATLFYHKSILDKRMDQYNEAMEDNLAVLTQDMKFYSNFVSNIVSYARGKSFLRILQYKKFHLETEYELLQNHLDEINKMMDQVEHWSTAFFVPVKQDGFLSREYVPDIETGPRENPLYTFNHNEEFMVPLNYTGDEIESPFGFIERFIIEREELFKDASMDD
ncbi:MAG: hypothetical protein K5682_01000 [Lachnospiraceae bacterium]|nr:hypothetical protein [Lachnospiraceae bacterium]